MKVKMILIIGLIFIIILMFFNINTVKATSSISDVIKGGDKFIAERSYDSTINEKTLKSTSDTVYNILLFCGMAIAVIMTGILGIKFMIGSVEEKAQIKDSLVPFIIGCIVIFGAFGLWKIFVIIGNRL